MYVITILWLNGVRTVNTFTDDLKAWEYAKQMAEQYKGCRVFFGTEVIAQSKLTEIEEDQD